MTALLCACLLLVPDTGRAWRASASYGFEAFTRDRATWHAASLQVGRRIPRGAVLGEMLGARRFDHSDAGVAVDGYRELWRGAYGWVRVQAAPGAAVLPRTDVTGELFQGFRGGWEVSGGYRRMAFAATTAHLWSGALGRTMGRWNLRLRTTVVPHPGATVASGALMLRRFSAAYDPVLDLAASVGKEVIAIGAGGADVRSTRALSGRWEYPVAGGWGVVVGASYAGTDGFPDRRGMSVGVSRRW